MADRHGEPYFAGDCAEVTECRRCINTTANPVVQIDETGHCQVCRQFSALYSLRAINDERHSFLASRHKPCLIGLSGGKDSSATLARLLELGFKPRAFTLDLGYYPSHIFTRAAALCQRLDVPHEVLDIRHLIRPVDQACYALTARLFAPDAPRQPQDAYRELYALGRQHYSAKCRHALPFLRSCQLCRRTVIRGYTFAAQALGARTVVLGMNEWAGLAAAELGGVEDHLSAMRTLIPPGADPVRVVHFPFLMGRSIRDTAHDLERLGWSAPEGERLVETNGNSCLFAAAAEPRAVEMLGFHPDATRLSREVTAGFIGRAEAVAATRRMRKAEKPVPEVLDSAGILRASGLRLAGRGCGKRISDRCDD